MTLAALFPAQRLRFLARFRKQIGAGANGCWEWQGSQDREGYGRVSLPKRRGTTGAHRVAFEIEHGYLPECVVHTCDNRLCVRPDHLEASTRAQVGARTKTLGRLAEQRGLLAPNRKLKPHSVQRIRRLLKNGRATVTELAKEYGVSPGTICDIRSRRSWGHLPDD